MGRTLPSFPPWLAPVVILLLAAAVRVVTLLWPHMDADMAVGGLMARHVLRGEWPVFFWGQPYCGALEAYLVAPVFALLGATRYTLFGAVAAVSLVFVGLAGWVGRMMWGRRAGLWAMLFAALPPYYLAWHSVLPRAAYIEVPILSLLLLGVTFRLVHRGGGRGWYFLYGLVAGLGLWLHFLMVYAILATGLYLWLARPRLPLQREMLLILAGLALGGLPLWLYNLVHPLATWEFLQRPHLSFSPWISLRDFWTIAVPVLLGAVWPRPQVAVVPWLWWLPWGLGLAGLGWLLWLRRRSLAAMLRLRLQEADGSELLLLFLLVVLAVTVAQGEGPGRTCRHYVPFYAAAVPLAGYLAEQVWRRRRGLAVILVVLALGSNLAGVLASSRLLDTRARRAVEAEISRNRRLLAELRARGIRRLWAMRYWEAMPLTFDSGEEVIVAAPGDHHYPPYPDQVARAVPSAYLVKGARAAMAAALRGAGARWREFRVGPYHVFYDLRPPDHGLEQVAPRGWSLGASPRPDWAPAAADLDRRAWRAGPPQRPGMWLRVDLGREVEGLCMLRLLCGPEPAGPRRLVVETSRHGRRWQTALRLQDYRGTLLYWCGGRLLMDGRWGRQDLYFPPRTARYLRLRQEGRDPRWPWRVVELSLYRRAATRPALEPGRLAATAEKLGLQRVYADGCLSPFLPPRLRPERDILPARLQGLGLAVTPAAATGLEDFLSRRGLAWQRTAAGGALLYHHLQPRRPGLRVLPPGGLRASAGAGRDPARALDRRPETRWTTGRPRRAGDWFRLDLPRPLTLAGLELDSRPSPYDLPPAMRLELSPDGKSWHEVSYQLLPAGEKLVFAGDRLLAAAGARLRLRFSPRRAKALRLTLTAGDPVYDWSLYEVALLAVP